MDCSPERGPSQCANNDNSRQASSNNWLAMHEPIGHGDADDDANVNEAESSTATTTSTSTATTLFAFLPLVSHSPGPDSPGTPMR